LSNRRNRHERLDHEHQDCSPAHVAAGFTTAPDGKRMSINVEVIGGSLMVQHYVETLAQRQPGSIARKESETPLFAASVERAALRN
jgi:hypothetical protein